MTAEVNEMSTFGSRIRLFRKLRGMTQFELAQQSGYLSRAAICKIEKDERDVPREKVLELAKALGVHPQRLLEDDQDIRKRVDPTMLALLDGDIDAFLRAADSVAVAPELLGRENSMPKLPEGVVPMPEMPKRRIPLIGEVAAGKPILAEEQHDIYIDSPDKADYALTVRGDSMTPTYLDGDVVYIRHCSDVPNGQVAVVLIDDSATLKHVYKAGSWLTLISDNPTYPPMRIDLSEHEYVRILGTVCGYTRMYK